MMPEDVQRTVETVKDCDNIPVFAVMSHPENSTSFILDVYRSYSKAEDATHDVENGEIEVYQIDGDAPEEIDIL